MSRSAAAQRRPVQLPPLHFARAAAVLGEEPVLKVGERADDAREVGGDAPSQALWFVHDASHTRASVW